MIVPMSDGVILSRFITQLDWHTTSVKDPKKVDRSIVTEAILSVLPPFLFRLSHWITHDPVFTLRLYKSDP